MDEVNAVSVKNLTKTYKLYKNHTDRVKEAFHPLRKKYYHPFKALDNISFDIKRGQAVGVIGKNGSGKSTLLQIVSGVTTPTSGDVVINGKISALLELGIGFNPEYTGIENVYFYGSIMGYPKEEIENNLDDILSFADIGQFVYQPVKTYSSGMYIRLAFAIAVSVNPDILIVDEALAVGDMFFQAKCMDRMRIIIDKEDTNLIFVSHDIGAIKSLCDKAIFLNNGKIVDYGKSDRVTEEYFNFKVHNEQKVLHPKQSFNKKNQNSYHPQTTIKQSIFYNDQDFIQRASFKRIQNGKANYINIQLINQSEDVIESVEYGQNVILRMGIEVNEDIKLLAHGYHIRNSNGLDVIYSDSLIENKNIENACKGDNYIVDWNFRVTLVAGNYTIACVISNPINQQYAQVDFCDFIPIAIQFQMQPRKDSCIYGLVHWENTVIIEKCDSKSL